MSNPAIRVENIGKRYRIGLKEEQSDTLVGAVASALKSPLQSFRNLRKLSTFEAEEAEDIVWALRDVSFNVKHGEAIGLIGRNGAGKSTLLKVLSRITEPTTGRIDLHGRVASLLEVGTGFHPELTGRENTYLNGAILGMTKAEVDHKFDEIVAFSEIEKFIDTPVKRYSSGMRVRLAFAVAAHLEPEILLVDEVLAVGDLSFQKKCLGKMDDVAGEGRTVVFVSHHMGLIHTLCERAILLDKGQVVFDGDVGKAIELYAQDGESSARFVADLDEDLPAQILEAEVLDESGTPRSTFDLFEPVRLRVRYRVRETLVGSCLGFSISRQGVMLFHSFDSDENLEVLERRLPGDYETVVQLPEDVLKAGGYNVGFGFGIVSRGSFQKLESALQFSIEERTEDTSLKSYAARRDGIIACPLEWTERSLEAYSISE